MDAIFASSDLVGKNIGGWNVIRQLDNNDITTRYARFFYVEQNGGNAIMKVIDNEKCNTGDKEEGLSRNALMSRETTAFNYETKIAEACAGQHMGNVIRYIESGEIELDGYPIPTVTYIVYEQSEGKIGKFLTFSSKATFAADLKMLIEKIRSLHQVAKGVRQLHTHFIAHHNITPQSIEVFESSGKHKLSGLHTSRSQQQDLQSPDHYRLFNGDLTFAPPEAFFAYKISDEMAAYYQIDNYMLGNMIVYYLTALNMTTLLNHHLPYSLKEMASHSANYLAVLPEITNAFNTVLDNLKSCVRIDELQQPIIELIECLCNPDPERRGYPGSFKTARANVDLQRVITRLDVLYNKAELILAKKNFV